MNIRLKPDKKMTYEGREVVEIICKELPSERDARIAQMMKASNHNRMAVIATHSNGASDPLIYSSMTEAGEVLGIDPSHISKACKSKTATAGGFLWQKLNQQ